MTADSLVAGRIDEPVSPWAGIWIAEDIELVAQGVRSGSWVDGSLGVVSAGLDGLALVSDPAGALLQYGIAWLIEHVEPLSRALDWLAGDPAQIAAHARTWRTVAGSLSTEADDLARAVRRDVADWSGAAASAYRSWAGRREQSLHALGGAAEAMALITEGAGALIGTVRLMVRDAVATVVSRLIVYAAELVATAGLAAPLVVEQVASLCAAWGARIARWLRGLIASLRQLLSESAQLGRLIDALKGWLRSSPSPSRGADPAGPPPRKDPQVERQRVHDLGMDPATGKFRQAEADTAVRIEKLLGVELRRSTDERIDWVDADGKTYDAVGNFDGRHFDRQWPNLQTRIRDHLEKADLVPVDVSRFSPDQQELVRRFLVENDLGRAFMVGD